MKDRITKSFHDFKKNALCKQPSGNLDQNLSADIVMLRKLDSGEYAKVDGAFDIIKIVDVITDADEIDQLEEAAGGFQLSTDLSVKSVKRGDTIWLTAMLKRPHATTPFNQTTMGVIKARVVDYYYGLNKLKYVDNSNVLTESLSMIKQPNLLIYKNRGNAQYNHTIIRGDELYLCNIKRGEDMKFAYKGKIDRKIYSVNGELVHNPSKKTIYIIQNCINDSHEKRGIGKA